MWSHGYLKMILGWDLFLYFETAQYTKKKFFLKNFKEKVAICKINSKINLDKPKL